MKNNEKENLDLVGPQSMTVAEFLGMSTAEEHLMETRLALSNLVTTSRNARGCTQGELGKRLGLRPSRIRRLEILGDGVDTLFHAIYLLGVTPQEIGAATANLE